MVQKALILLFGSSKNECEDLCKTRGERFPSPFDLTTDAIETISITFNRDHSNQLDNSPAVIWTDGIFDYNDEIWTDSLGKAIPEELWENSTWLRKAFHASFYYRLFKAIWNGPNE